MFYFSLLSLVNEEAVTGNKLSDVHLRAFNDIKRVIVEAKTALMTQGIRTEQLAKGREPFDVANDVAQLLAGVPVEQRPAKPDDRAYIWYCDRQP